MRLVALIIVNILLLVAVSSSGWADRDAGSIELSANPEIIAADGRSVCTITARVRDRDGQLVSDGTEVRFSASLGVIEESETTSTGVARVKLVSGDISGISIVTATWVEGQAVAYINVEFADEPPMESGPRYINVESDEYLAYSVLDRVLEAVGNVQVRYRSLDLNARDVKIDLERNRLLAKGESRENPLTLKIDGGTAEGSVLVCDLASSKGLLLSAESGSVRQVNLSRAGVEIGDEANYTPLDFADIEIEDISMLIKAKRATIFPYDKIQFKAANVYVAGKRMISLPLYVLSLTGYQSDGDQYVGYSTGGLTLNFPFYYSLTPSSSGALLVRHGESAGWGWYGQKPGWFLDLRQKYATDRSQGSLVLSQVTSGDWGARFSHNQDLGKRTQGYLYLDYAAHRDLFGNLNLGRSFDKYTVGLSLYGAKYETGEDSLTSDLNIQTKPKPIGSLPLKYTLSTRSAYTTGGGFQGEGFSQSVQGKVYSNPIELANGLSVRSSLGLGYVWGNSSLSGLSTLATAVLDWRPSNYSTLQLSYRFADRASIYTSQTGRQSLSLTCYLTDADRRWQASLYAVKGLDYAALNLFADVSYRFGRDWRFGVRSTLNEFNGLSYNDLELALGKMVGNREIIAVWSKSQNRIMFELGAGAF